MGWLDSLATIADAGGTFLAAAWDTSLGGAITRQLGAPAATPEVVAAIASTPGNAATVEKHRQEAQKGLSAPISNAVGLWWDSLLAWLAPLKWWLALVAVIVLGLLALVYAPRRR